MADTQTPSNEIEMEPMESFSVWLPKSLVNKLNRMALSRSTETRLVSKAEVLRELVKRAKEEKR